MKKRQLSDLIRDEASQEVKSQETAPETIDQPTEIADMSSTSRSRMTKAQLDELVTELTTALDAEKKQVSTLQAQIETLENDLKDKTELINNLQTQLHEASQYQTELAEQKQLVEKLYAQLQKQEDIAIQVEERNQVIESLKAELEKVKNTTNSPSQSSGIVAKKEVKKESALTRQARELEPFAAPEVTKQKQLTNEDIGWFD